ncbi:MAG: SDR family NAD(P)-dependent oxidoreductase [Byssovorax sp.]
MTSTFVDRYGPWALVAGASQGLGAEFSRKLAARGLNLLLVARGAPALDGLAAEIRAAHPVEVRTAAIDLARADLGEQVKALAAGLDVGLVVYNAAAAHVGAFLDQSLASKLAIVDVNCRGPLVVLDALLPPMVERGRGGVILMTSLAASQGSPLLATYAASKAFDLVLGEGLWHELRPKGIDVLACRAGATRTPAYEKSNPAPGPSPVMEPGPVVDEALAALGKTPSFVPGAFNKAATFFMNHLLPRRTAVTIMGNASHKMYGKR